jgi:hypothetical protein
LLSNLSFDSVNIRSVCKELVNLEVEVDNLNCVFWLSLFAARNIETSFFEAE